jgi:tetratricopeptide (TPR) repeat protein
MPASVKSNPSAPVLVLIVLAVMIALYGVDKFLAAQEKSELEQEASSHFAAGQKLLNDGKPHQAIADFARAHSLDRTNREYLLSLAAAQLSDNRLSDARAILEETLDEDSNDGRANLLMARLMAQDGHFNDADSYYHRAIYGAWPSNLPTQTAKVRLELANMLAEHGGNQKLLSELLLLQNEPAQNVATKKQIAALFLKAGSAERAADAYHRLIREDRDDVDIYVGLGQAEILAGNYRLAENAFLDALRRRLNDSHIQSQLAMVARLATLDPTLRRLSSAEKYRRSVAILDLVQNELHVCLPNAPPPKPDKTRGPINNEMAEARLDQAEELWKQRDEACKQPPLPDDPLPLLMKKLSQ